MTQVFFWKSSSTQQQRLACDATTMATDIFLSRRTFSWIAKPEHPSSLRFCWYWEMRAFFLLLHPFILQNHLECSLPRWKGYTNLKKSEWHLRNSSNRINSFAWCQLTPTVIEHECGIHFLWRIFILTQVPFVRFELSRVSQKVKLFKFTLRHLPWISSTVACVVR